MKPLAISLFIFFAAFGVLPSAFAQYTFKKLTQESVTKTKTPTIAPIPKDWGDTSVTTYSGGSIEILLYFVNGDQYDNVFNPNPTGLYLNGQHFNFYCDPDKVFKQSVSMIADIYEFTYLKRNYLCAFTLKEQNTESKYKCYNLFDITDTKKITQVSFPSIHVGEDAFGDFNFDGEMDFVTVINRKPEGFKQKVTGNAYMVRAYAIQGNVAKELRNSKGFPHYIYGAADENMDNFSVLQCDWMIPLKDSTGVEKKAADYYTAYEIFNPKDNAIYTPEGVRVEKNRYSVTVGKFDDDGGAKEICEEIKKKKIGNGHGYDLFIMMDQYGPKDIKWVVLVGNYVTKTQAQQAANTLKQYGFIDVQIRDLKAAY
jgi:hypothetical protein